MMPSGGGGGGGFEHVGDAAAVAHRHRRDVLLHAVLVDLEFVLLQIGDEAALARRLTMTSIVTASIWTVKVGGCCGCALARRACAESAAPRTTPRPCDQNPFSFKFIALIMPRPDAAATLRPDGISAALADPRLVRAAGAPTAAGRVGRDVRGRRRLRRRRRPARRPRRWPPLATAAPAVRPPPRADAVASAPVRPVAAIWTSSPDAVIEFWLLGWRGRLCRVDAVGLVASAARARLIARSTRRFSRQFSRRRRRHPGVDDLRPVERDVRDSALRASAAISGSNGSRPTLTRRGPKPVKNARCGRAAVGRRRPGRRARSRVCRERTGRTAPGYFRFWRSGRAFLAASRFDGAVFAAARAARLARRRRSCAGRLRASPLAYRRDGFARAVDEREPHLVADRVIAPDLGDVNLVVLAEPPRDIDHAGRHIQVERRAQLGEVRPLRQRFEVVDRLAGLHLDDGLQLMAAFLRLKHEVGIDGGRAGADGDVLLGAGFIPASYRRRNLACSRRMMRSCSSCSRTGRTRIGLTKRLPGTR